MPGLDLFLSKALNSTIKNNLDKNMLAKVEQRLLEKYGINLAQSTEDFAKLDKILREFFGDGTDNLEKSFLKNIFDMQTPQAPNIDWLTIEDPSLAKLILETLADDDKKNILYTVLDGPRTILGIIENAKISQTSGYRKVNSLINNGLLIEDGYVVIRGGKKISKYRSVLENVEISMEKNKVTIKVKLTKESIHASAVMNSFCCILN
jgi:hypothetical protein